MRSTDSGMGSGGRGKRGALSGASRVSVRQWPFLCPFRSRARGLWGARVGEGGCRRTGGASCARLFLLHSKKRSVQLALNRLRAFVPVTAAVDASTLAYFFFLLGVEMHQIIDCAGEFPEALFDFLALARDHLDGARRLAPL